MHKASGFRRQIAAGLLALGCLTAAPADGLATLDLTALVDSVSRDPWPDGKAPAGSGFVVDSRGTVFTAAHVIAGCRKISVALRNIPDQKYAAQIIGQDSRLDAAVVAVPALRGRQRYLRFTEEMPDDGAALSVGGASREATPGRAKALGMATEPNAGRIFHFRATLSPGSSGLPVLNDDGLVVAFVVGKLEKHPGIGIGVTGGDLKRFFAYFGIPAPRARTGIETLADDLAGLDEPPTKVDVSTVKVTCK